MAKKTSTSSPKKDDQVIEYKTIQETAGILKCGIDNVYRLTRPRAGGKPPKLPTEDRFGVKVIRLEHIKIYQTGPRQAGRPKES